MSPGKRIIVVAIIGILLVGFGFSQINYNLKQQLNADLLLFKTTANSYTMDANIPSSLGKFTFTHIPLEDDAYDSITPLGNLNPPSHTFPSDHIYFLLKNGTYDIVAPAKGVITQISNNTQEGGNYQDYTLRIRHTITFYSYFYHMSGLADWILEKTGKITGFTLVSIPVEAGQVVGRAEKQPGGSFCLDWGAKDYDVTLSFIHPETYGYGVEVHTVCPLDYLEESLKEKAYQKVNRIGEPRGGKIDYDILGRLSGNWFLEGSQPGVWNYSTNLALVYYVHNASQMVVSVGGNVLAPLPIGVFNATGPDFREVSNESGKVIYHLVGAYPETVSDKNYTLVVQVVGDERIKVEAFEGHQEEVDFTDKAVFYNRIGPFGSLNSEIILLGLAILNQLSTYSQQTILPVLGVLSGAGAFLIATLTLKLYKKKP
ncbi:MAG: hypothetical protein ACUVXA_06360 [Candidatus Jordarchaeum sp.]|uniref:hypothetical protein n=1 Tax=Candidatus Jordarchaeum sp. TaxID=2823881 RepID=UPI004049B2B4